MRFDLGVFLSNVTPRWLQRVLVRRCSSYYPVDGGWSLRCQERAGHEGDHRHGTVITWPQYSPTSGSVHGLEDGWRRR